MATKYFALLTNIGAAKLANATALGAKIEITQMAVGDGNGALPTPTPAQTALTHELRRAQLNMLTIDPVNTNQIIAEQVIPEDVGGWWIREIGLFDKDGDMIAVANCAETYKPQLQEGSGRVQVIRVILIVSSTEAVTLKIDPSVVLATRKYVDDAIVALGLGTAAKKEVGTEEGQIPDMSAWISSVGVNGWRKTPDGYIEQWGIGELTTETAKVNFPIPFPTKVLWVGEQDNSGGTRKTFWQLNEITNSGFTAVNLATITKGATTVNAAVNARVTWYARGI